MKGTSEIDHGLESVTELVPAMKAFLIHLFQNGESFLLELCRTFREETLYLEFKQKEKRDNSGMTDNDKKRLGEALSGFSNSDGGVLILGVETKKHAHVDVAHRCCPIAEIASFENYVKSLVPGYTSPENRSVYIRSVASLENSGSGYLVVVVPKGVNRPYMSNAVGHKKYFRKTSDGILPLEHYEVIDLTRVEHSPVLQLVTSVRYLGGKGLASNFAVRVFLRNDGVVLADRPYLRILKGSSFLNFGTCPQVDMKTDPPEFGGSIRFQADPGVAVMPDDSKEMAITQFHCSGVTDYIENYRWDSLPQADDRSIRYPLCDLSIAVKYGAANCPQVATNFVFKANELFESALKTRAQ